MPDVCNAKEDKDVPAHHTEIKQVGDPHELSHPKNDKDSDYLSEQDTAGRTQGFCKAPYQRVQFEGTVMKRDQGRSQIKHLQHDKTGPSSQDISDLHLFEAIEAGSYSWSLVHKIIRYRFKIAGFCAVSRHVYFMQRSTGIARHLDKSWTKVPLRKAVKVAKALLNWPMQYLNRRTIRESPIGLPQVTKKQ